MIAFYLDTQVAVWLAHGNLNKLTSDARNSIRTGRLLVSPMLVLELEYLFEIGRITISSQDLLLKLKAELGVDVCDLNFPAIITIATHESWTRDPFDRIIVAQAKANGIAFLISSDELIKKSYIKTVW